MSADLSPYPPLAPASGRAVAALVVGIAGLVCCHLAGPVALFLALRERSAIRAGQASVRGEGYATAGLVLGAIQTVLLVLGFLALLVWLFVLGGMAMLEAAHAS
jgi:hypothetical protein